jgi:regulatory protein
MVITKIEPQRRRDRRRSIYIDGNYAFGVDIETVLKLDLYEGKELSEADCQTICFEEEKGRARSYAELLLSYRERSRRELETRLSKKGYGPEVIERVLEELTASGLLSDERFARAWVRDRMLRVHKGPIVIKMELRRKGVAEDVIDRAIASEGLSEAELARRIIESRSPRLSGLDPAKRRKRLQDLLLRRGLSFDVVLDALKDEP